MLFFHHTTHDLEQVLIAQKAKSPKWNFHMRKPLKCLISYSYYTSTIFPGVNTQPRTAKRQRLMTPPQTRSTGIIASPQIVLQSPQSAQQQMTANKLSSAAANLLQLQHQQQLLLAAAMPMTNSVQCQSSIITNGDHEGPTPPTVDNFKLYSECKLQHLRVKLKLKLSHSTHIQQVIRIFSFVEIVESFLQT